MEGFALWVGNREERTFYVRETIIPAQQGHSCEDGVCVTVGPDELHRLNVQLYAQKMSIIAQLHSHPGSAYHSETDDSFPIATTVGCLSLVIPDFACFPFSLGRCAVYRLTAEGAWSFVVPSDVEKLVTIVT
ncbi:MAG TPA: Mov34/MPN/PAD-1 family protein [Terriglobales bacterium]